MSTQIKKNGNWVTVAGGTRMWVGTKAALQAALDAGELVDGTAVMVTDDYEEASYPHPDWANAIRLTVDQLYAGYTAPSDGMLVCTGVMTPKNYTADARIITVNGIPIVKGQWKAEGAYTYGSISCPVSKGNLIKSNMSDAWEGETRYFVPWKA